MAPQGRTVGGRADDAGGAHPRPEDVAGVGAGIPYSSECVEEVFCEVCLQDLAHDRVIPGETSPSRDLLAHRGGAKR